MRWSLIVALAIVWLSGLGVGLAMHPRCEAIREAQLREAIARCVAIFEGRREQ